ncbi:TM0996/MTH895 family glutaredoxin-like protein [Patescibacteria group bacterium]|nr:TM0996/MTH895 family glutaredoxin-like protein [Patescibacteria group bacterium]
MKIQVLGSGCPNCQKLEENAREAVKELGLKAEVTHIYDINKIIEMGVMMTPALVVEDEVVISGKVASVEEIKEVIRE